MKLFKASLIVAAVALLLPAFAFAQQIVQTEVLNSAYPTWTQTLEFEKFNSSLGELTGITIIFSLQSNEGSITLTNKSSDTATATYSFGVNATITSALDLVYVSGSSLGTVSAVTSGSQTLAGYATGNPVSFSTLSSSGTGVLKNIVYSEYTGSGNFSLSVTANQQASANSVGGVDYTVSAAMASGSVTVIYNYKPSAVPEPSAWAMLFGGLGMLLVMRRSFKQTL